MHRTYSSVSVLLLNGTAVSCAETFKFLIKNSLRPPRRSLSVLYERPDDDDETLLWLKNDTTLTRQRLRGNCLRQRRRQAHIHAAVVGLGYKLQQPTLAVLEAVFFVDASSCGISTHDHKAARCAAQSKGRHTLCYACRVRPPQFARNLATMSLNERPNNALYIAVDKRNITPFAGRQPSLCRQRCSTLSASC